jgi:hypothetical protein
MAKTIIEELVGIVGLDVDEASFKRGAKALDNVKKQYERVASAATKLGVAAAAVAGFTVVTNKMTAEQKRMADAVGISTEALNAYGMIAKEAGLNTDNVVDLVEELNNKLGESKGLEEITAVKEATAILGLEFEQLRKLKPEQQFFEILNAAKQLEDQQKAVSAADILMGGEANKFIGLLRSQDQELQDLIDSYTKLNFLTAENEEAAVAFDRSFAKLTTVFGTASKQLGALLGKAIKPIIDAFVDWTTENKELAQTIISVFSVVLPSALAIAGVAITAITIKLTAMGLAVLGVTWPILGIIAAIGLLATAWTLIINDIYTFAKHGDKANTVLGAMVGKVKSLAQWLGNLPTRALDWITEKLASIGSLISGLSIGGFNLGGFGFGSPETSMAGGTTNNTTNNSTANIQIDATGMDASQLNEAIDKRMNESNAAAVRDNSTGIVR